jgi:predicted MFS family arabinose efflux permease
MALRFGVKSLAGFGLGTLAQRRGARITMMVTVGLVGSALVWPFFFSGMPYLLAFGLMGAGELGGVYFVNYVISISDPARTTRNLVLLSLVSPASALDPAIHGRIADSLGFNASFAVGITMAALSLLLLFSSGRGKVRAPTSA